VEFVKKTFVPVELMFKCGLSVQNPSTQGAVVPVLKNATVHLLLITRQLMFLTIFAKYLNH
jgi:hypothetical protein